MALKYVASNTTYDFGKSEYTTTSNKYKRLNYIANGKTYQIGLATDSTATQYSPLKMKINDSTYYIGRTSSRSSSTSSASTYSSRYITGVNTYTDTASYIGTSVHYDRATTFRTLEEYGYNSYYIKTESMLYLPPEGYTYTHTAYEESHGYYEHLTYSVEVKNYFRGSGTYTYAKSESKTSNAYSTTTASSSASSATTVASNNFV